jgi:hypothetical protein
MCKANEQAEIQGKDGNGKKVARPPNRLTPLPPLAQMVQTELKRIRKCDADLPAATPAARYARCYVDANATCRCWFGKATHRSWAI